MASSEENKEVSGRRSPSELKAPEDGTSHHGSDMDLSHVPPRVVDHDSDTGKSSKHRKSSARELQDRTHSKKSRRSFAATVDKTSDKDETKTSKTSKTMAEGSSKKLDKEGVTQQVLVAEMSPPGGHTTTTKTDAVNVVKQRLILVGIVICFGCIIAMGVFIHVAGATSQATQNLPCIGQECHEVAEFIESLMDDSVNPCTDFYRHVCARWIKDTKRPSSFMTDAAQNFSETLHEALSRAYLHGENHELMQNAAIFYNSCLTYLEKDARIKSTTDELFEALNISVSKWLIRDDPMQFFRDVLRLSLVHRFHTLLAFSVIEDSGIVSLKVTRWYPLHNFIPPGHMDRLKEYVSRFITVVSKDKASDAVVEEILILDKNREIFTNANDSEQKLQDAECETFPAKTWIQVLRQELSLTENVPIIVSGMYTICKELNEVLVQAKLVARALYMLALVSRSVLSVDHVRNEDRDAYSVRHKCYVEMQFAFEDTWLHLLSGLLNVTKGVEEVVDAYMATTRERLKSRVAAWTWMAEEDRRAAIKQLNKIHLVRFYGASLKKKAVLCNSGKKVTPTDFVSNVVNLYVRDIKNCLLPSVDSRADLGLKQLLLGTDLAAHRSIVVVPPTFTVPPWYYRHVEDDKYINIAMFVTHLAHRVLSSAIFGRLAGTYGWSNGTFANYFRIKDCYARHSASLHTKLNDTQFDHAFSVMESLRVAYEVKRHYDRDLVSRYKPRLISSNLLFYKRACLMLCTAQDTNPFDLQTTYFETAYASCILAAANAPTFIDIFGCNAGDTMTVIGSCYVH